MVRNTISMLLLMAFLLGCERKTNQSIQKNFATAHSTLDSLDKISEATIAHDSDPFKKMNQSQTIPNDSFSDYSILAALGSQRGVVIQDDCSYHENKDQGAYRVQCSSYHLHWHPDSATIASMNVIDKKDGRDSVYSRVVSIENESFGDTAVKVTFVESVPPSYGCPPCVPALGVMVWAFRQNDNEYRLLSENINVANIGQNGLISSAPDKLELKKDRNGYLFSQSTIFQGISETIVVLMGIVDGEFRVLLNVITESDNEGACEKPASCWKYTSTIEIKENAENPLNDIVLTRSGTRMTEDGLTEFKEYLHYQFDGKEYVLRKSR